MSARRRVLLFTAAVLALAACGTPNAPSAADLQATVDVQVQAAIASQLATLPTATSVPPTAIPPTPTPARVWADKLNGRWVLPVRNSSADNLVDVTIDIDGGTIDMQPRLFRDSSSSLRIAFDHEEDKTVYLRTTNDEGKEFLATFRFISDDLVEWDNDSSVGGPTRITRAR